MSAAKQALDLTTRTIDRRAFHFRNLVVTLVLLVAGCAIAALVQWSWRPLVGWLAVVPLCGAFLVLDNYFVSRWQARILNLWTDEGLHIEDFAQSILSLRLLPGATLRGMLALLPASGQGPAVDRLPAAARALAARLYACFHRGARDFSVAFTLAYTATVAAVGWALLAWDWRPLIGCLAIVGAFIAGRTLNARRLRRCRAIVDEAHRAGVDLQSVAANLVAARGGFD